MHAEQRHPSLIMAPTNHGFNRMFAPWKLTLGLFFPIAAYSSDMPPLDNQAVLAQRADEGGFAALWTRILPMRHIEYNPGGKERHPGD